MSKTVKRTARVLTFIAMLMCAVHMKAQVIGNQSADPCDSSQVRPPVAKADLEIVKRARQILDSPKKWNRADTRACPAGAKTFSLYCALEKATNEVSGNFQHRDAAMQEARFAIEELAPRVKNYDHRLMGYNNDPKTTFADIEEVFRLLETRITDRLKEDPSVAQASAARVAAACASAEIRIVKRVREILDSPSKWDRASTQVCPKDARSFSLYCAFEKATREVKGNFEGDGAAINQVRSSDRPR